MDLISTAVSLPSFPRRFLGEQICHDDVTVSHIQLSEV